MAISQFIKSKWTLCFLILGAMVIFAIGLWFRSRNPMPVEVPAGLVAVTGEQKALVAKVQRLSYGMSKEEVIERLGRPEGERADKLFYTFEEGVEGGYYVNATIGFDENQNAISAKLGFGCILRTIEQYDRL